MDTHSLLILLMALSVVVIVLGAVVSVIVAVYDSYKTKGQRLESQGEEQQD